MKEVKKLWGYLESMWGGGSNGKDRRNAFSWMILVGLAGAGLMMFQSFWADPAAEQAPSQEPSLSPGAPAFMGKEEGEEDFARVERQYEEKIKQIIEKTAGVGKTEVAVTLESTEELVIVRNFKDDRQVTQEQDVNGASRQITNYSRSGEVVFHGESGTQTPIVYKKIKPKIRGVVIVAAGAENPVVKKLILEAVERGMGVPAHRISVLPHKP